MTLAQAFYQTGSRQIRKLDKSQELPETGQQKLSTTTQRDIGRFNHRYKLEYDCKLEPTKGMNYTNH